MRHLPFLASLLLHLSSAAAAPITYSVMVNTSSVFGTVGSLDFSFNPGPLLTQSASAQILNFTVNGSLAGGPSLTGDVSGGPLSATLTFDNATAFNDYFEEFTFGSFINFDVSLAGPALSSPDGVSTSGSTFAFSMFTDPAGTLPALTTDLTDGFAFKLDIKLDGTTTLTNFSIQTSVVPLASAVPEPTSGVMMSIATALIGTFICVKRHTQASVAFWCFRNELGDDDD